MPIEVTTGVGVGVGVGTGVPVGVGVPPGVGVGDGVGVTVGEGPGVAVAVGVGVGVGVLAGGQACPMATLAEVMLSTAIGWLALSARSTVVRVSGVRPPCAVASTSRV
jgi:hypothetical protein